MAEEETLRTLGVVLFPGFELLDVYGPLEAFGHLPEAFRIVQVAEQAGPVTSAQGPRVVADAGARRRAEARLAPRARRDRHAHRGRQREAARVAPRPRCHGRARHLGVHGRGAPRPRRPPRRSPGDEQQGGLQLGHGRRGHASPGSPRRAGSHDGRFSTSSGVSAGIDMALDLIAKHVDADTGEALARAMEYEWHRDAAGIRSPRSGDSLSEKGDSVRLFPSRRPCELGQCAAVRVDVQPLVQVAAAAVAVVDPCDDRRRTGRRRCCGPRAACPVSTPFS